MNTEGRYSPSASRKWAWRRGGAASLLISVWVASFIGVFGTAVALAPEGRVLGQLLYGLPLFAWAVARWRPRGDTFDLWAAAALVGYFVVVVLARDMLGALETLAAVAMLVVLFAFMREVARNAHLQAMVAFGALSAATVWLVVVDAFWIREKLAWISLGGGLPNLVESVRTPFWLSGNIIPFLVLMSAPLVPWVSVAARRLLAPIYVPAALVAVAMSGGRAGALGIAVAAVVLLILRRRDLTRRGPWVAPALGAAALATAVGFALFGQRLLDGSGLLSRFPIWEQAMRAFLVAPLAGNGPSSYSWMRLDVGEPPVLVNTSHAHNVVLQAAAEGGLLLVLVLTLTVWLTLRRVRQRWSSMDFRHHVLLAALIGAAVACQMDDPTRLPAISALAVTQAAWMVGPPTVEGSGRHGRRLLKLVPIAALVIALPAVVAVDAARISADRARAEARDGQFQQAVSHALDATTWYPDQPGYQLLLAQQHWLAGDREAARLRFETAAKLQPADARAWGGLAATAVDAASRIEYLKRASHLSAEPRYAWSLGTELEAIGEPDAAAEAFARAVALNVQLIGLLPVESTESRIGIDGVIQKLPDQIEVLPGGTVDQEGLRSALAVVLNDPDQSLDRTWQAVLLARSGAWDEARATAELTTRGSPYNPSSWLLRARIAEHDCDLAAAERFYLLAQLVSINLPSHGRLELTPDLPYREVALDAYQPDELPFPATAQVFPGALLSDEVDCSN